MSFYIDERLLYMHELPIAELPMDALIIWLSLHMDALIISSGICPMLPLIPSSAIWGYIARALILLAILLALIDAFIHIFSDRPPIIGLSGIASLLYPPLIP